MIGLLVTLGGIGIYVAGWLSSAVAVARYASHTQHEARCHGEGHDGYNWGKGSSGGSYCRRHCPKGCFRADDRSPIESVAIGSVAALLWPALLIPALVWLIAFRTSRPAASLTASRIAELERELGMDKETA